MRICGPCAQSPKVPRYHRWHRPRCCRLEDRGSGCHPFTGCCSQCDCQARLSGRGVQHARGVEPVRKLGSKALDAHRRTVSGDTHKRAGNPYLRAIAQDRKANAPSVSLARCQHLRGRSRQRGLYDAHRQTPNPGRGVSSSRVGGCQDAAR